MNKVFKIKGSKIELNPNWHLTSDGDFGIVLTFHENRQREKKDGGIEDYLFEDKWFFTRICQALRHFVDATQNESKDLKELLDKVSYNTELLEKLDKEFKQFE